MKNKNFIEFAKIIGKLKRIPRTGWKMRGVKNPESIADHSFRTTVLGMLLADLEKLNTEKIIRMLLLHDINEALSGDIPTIEKEKIPHKAKKIEKDAIKKALSILPEELKEKYLSLWKEMEEGKTLEANFCKDTDKLEMMIQLLEYETEDESNKEKLKEFWVREDLNAPRRYPLLKELYKELKNQREKK